MWLVLHKRNVSEINRMMKIRSLQSKYSNQIRLAHIRKKMNKAIRHRNQLPFEGDHLVRVLVHSLDPKLVKFTRVSYSSCHESYFIS